MLYCVTCFKYLHVHLCTVRLESHHFKSLFMQEFKMLFLCWSLKLSPKLYCWIVATLLCIRYLYYLLRPYLLLCLLFHEDHKELLLVALQCCYNRGIIVTRTQYCWLFSISCSFWADACYCLLFLCACSSIELTISLCARTEFTLFSIHHCFNLCEMGRLPLDINEI